MKVKFLKTRNYLGGIGTRKVGDIVELPDDLALQWIEQGFVALYREPKKRPDRQEESA